MNESNNPRFSIVPGDYEYLDNFNQAICNTKNLQLRPPNFAVDFDFSPDLEELYRHVQKALLQEERDPKNETRPPAFNCILYARSMCVSLSKYYGKPMMLTSGYLIGEGRKTFYEPLAELEARLSTTTDSPINLHAWVILPDLTIVDVTLIPTIRAVRAEDRDLTNDILIKNMREQRAEDEFCYQPVLVGSEYWDKASMRPHSMIKLVDSGPDYNGSTFQKWLLQLKRLFYKR